MIRGIILAGGSGKRLWPISREKTPKQLLPFFLKKTFIEETFERLSPVVDSVAVSTGASLAPKIKKLLPKTKLIVEPARRDTAAAIGLCVASFADEDILVFTPSDHFVGSSQKFRQTIRQAISIAKKKEGIVVVGIKPRTPTTVLGYFEPGKSGVVRRFCEKPVAALAKKYVKKGFLWNGGIFVARAGVMMEQFRLYAPNIYAELLKIRGGASPKKVFPRIRRISFDFAVMERAKRVFFVRAGFYWNDIGGYNAIAEVVKGENVVMVGKLAELGSWGNIVSSKKGKTVALIDCNDLIVVDTKDALLVCPRSSADKIKKLVEEKIPKELQ